MTDTLTKTWKQPHLIQRLKAPTGKPEPVALGAFGGGLSRGGLSDQAVEILKNVFRFEYMGAAEYEWGAIPKTLQTIAAESKDYVPGIVGIDPRSLPDLPFWVGRPAKDWEELQEHQKEFRDSLPSEMALYYFCHCDHEEQVRSFLQDLAAKKARVRDYVGLEDALLPEPGGDGWSRTVGGLELDNHWFWFGDEEVWERTVLLFQGDEEPNTEPTRSDEQMVGVPG